MLLAIDLHEDLIDAEGIALTPVLSFQSACIDGAKLDTPEADGFMADGYATLGWQIFDIAVAQVEPVIQPDSVADDVRRESVALVGIHWPILLESDG